MNQGSPRKFAALIFGRYNSSRLPGKVLFRIGESTVLGICVDKLRSIDGLHVIVATSDQPTDDPIAAWCAEQGVTVFRGDLDNVAARTQACLKRFPCDAFFRINADSPFLQADLVSRAIEVFENVCPDMVTNVLERSYPYGIAVELVKSETFLKHAPEFKGDENEHITSHFYRRREQFKIENIRNNEDLSSKRFVLDTREDWENLQRLYLRDQNIFNYNLSQLIKSTQN